MCSRGGGRNTPVNGVQHECHLCNHGYAIEMIGKLEKENKQLKKLVEKLLSVNACNVSDMYTAQNEANKKLRELGE